MQERQRAKATEDSPSLGRKPGRIIGAAFQSNPAPHPNPLPERGAREQSCAPARMVAKLAAGGVS